jgi:drug/metabolite transporter (DMT)-like permease
MVAVALVLGGDPVPRRAAEAVGLVPGVLATLAVLLFLLASQRGLLSVAAVITSLYPAFTVLLAILVLQERVHRWQGVGLALCATSVVCVSLA